MEKTFFGGYVVNRESERALGNFEWPFPPRDQRPRPVVLATSGGGEDGSHALTTFVRGAARAAAKLLALAESGSAGVPPTGPGEILVESRRPDAGAPGRPN